MAECGTHPDCLGVFITEPFGVSVEIAERRPWEAMQSVYTIRLIQSSLADLLTLPLERLNETLHQMKEKRSDKRKYIAIPFQAWKIKKES